jgi:hypothetical protein
MTGSRQRRDQNVRIRRGEPLEVALITGQYQATTCLDRHCDDVRISEMIRSRTRTRQQPPDQPGEMLVVSPTRR